MRNKLFAILNIVSLAISMSLGLLLIAFVLDWRSYDRFHEQGERIYRITSIEATQREQVHKLATASIKAGALIRQKVTGVEAVSILRNDFSGDAQVADNTLPIKGYWAEPSFFKVFTFPLLEGNPETALRDPYSMVLTEAAAKKLFGDRAALGQSIRLDSINYQVTGIVKNPPFFSHLNFEVLVSFSSTEQSNPSFGAWSSTGANYVYLLLAANAKPTAVQAQLDAIAAAENLAETTTQIQLELLPLYKIVIGETLRDFSPSGATGPHMSPSTLWVLAGLTFVVLLSACFNYTNLSLARALRRFREIGLRKAIGAQKGQIQHQFLTEAILIALFALVMALLLFLVLRPQLINLAPEMQRTVKLQLTPTTVAIFVGFAVVVGIVAGFLPALFFSKISAIHALGNAASLKVFHHLNLRRALVLIQYTVTLIFITTTVVGYVQYHNILTFDLGFATENILNIYVQGNKADALYKELSTVPEVKALSRSLITTGVGNAWGGVMKYGGSPDSALVLTNHVDENYLPVHDYHLLAGRNLTAHPSSAQSIREVIVNEQVLRQFNIAKGEPEKAIGAEVRFRSFQVPEQKLTIVGVMQDFHYGRVENRIGPVAFLPWIPQERTIINVKLQSSSLPETLAKIESIWKKIDRVHPFKATFYEEEIEAAYREFSAMIKIIGFLSFLAISIASMGLFGMVVYTTETRLKEMGIRKVMGASALQLIYLLSRGFLLLLTFSAIIALPITYVLFEYIVLRRFPYHTPVHLPELLVGFFAVLLMAILMMGSQTLQAARSNPVAVLKGG